MIRICSELFCTLAYLSIPSLDADPIGNGATGQDSDQRWIPSGIFYGGKHLGDSHLPGGLCLN